MSSSDAEMSLKLLIDSRSKKVLFAEAGKDFVDFIFSLLTLPLGTVIKLISAKSMAGALGRLYESVEKLSETYVRPKQNKSSLLQPKIARSSSNITVGASVCFILTGVSVEPPLVKLSEFKYYNCLKCLHNVTTTYGLKCPICFLSMTNTVNYVFEQTVNASNSGKKASNYEDKESGGFVRGGVSYMVMDNLEVVPMSSISTITLLNKFNKENGDLFEEKIVSVGKKEGLALLQTALKSITVLTDVFLKEEKVEEKISPWVTI